MEELILITWLNDFIFCPASIYFHNLYGERNRLSFQETSQINGANAHNAIDSGKYSTRKNTLSGIDVYCEEYGLVGKIDTFFCDSGKLTERKKHISVIYDGYVYQLYGQCYALREMGYQVREIELHSLDDNKTYPISLPENNLEYRSGFERIVSEIRSFDLSSFKQNNREKCARCIYEPLCDSSRL